MPYYKSSDEWLAQSQLLLEARPTTTRITTTYSIKPHKASKRSKTTAEEEESASAATGAAPRGSLVLKTYDPHTGTALKYRTTKAAEVSRLILSLGRLSRPMAGLPELKDEPMVDADAAAGSGAGTPLVEDAPKQQPPQPSQQQQGGSGGKGKKKKGKK
ncbi:signal recognition particle 9 kDa protein-domain-containing protein [Xylariales sp. PMI_506]|nr:signal recognition particle 9 kDa protein-domain-containing protein [Xylariales sp. PMI_506]